MKLTAFATFQASFPIDSEYDRPEGCYLARTIEQHLRTVLPVVEEFDNWRDCGWCIPCTVEECQVWVCFARYLEGEAWQLFIEPLGLPGFIGRLFGKRPPPHTAAIHRLAIEVDRILKNEPAVSEVGWAISADPRRCWVPSPTTLSWPFDAGA